MKFAWLFLILYIPFGLWSQPAQSFGAFDTFFSYTPDELNEVHSIPLSNVQLTQEKFEKWDRVIYELTADPLPDGLSTRIMPYLYVAQRDFALLSYQIAQQWVGSPDALTIKVLNLVFPDFHPSQSIQEDSFSSKIGEIVFRKVEERLKQEQDHLKDYPVKEGPTYWKEEPPHFGQRVGTCQPWLLASLKDLQASPPPDFHSIIWTYGLEEIQFDQAHLTPEERKLIFYWAGKEGPESGNWFAIANEFLKGENLSLPDFLFVRAALTMAYVDSVVAAFDSKYTYWVARPHMRNPDIIQVVNCPKHPSYPSAHSVTSATAATVLSHFFPNQTHKWRTIAIEAGNTRIWGGLHYMYDNEQGLIQGEKVGRAIVKMLGPLSRKTAKMTAYSDRMK